MAQVYPESDDSNIQMNVGNIDKLVSPSIWKALPDDVKETVMLKLAPKGFNADLWDKLEASTQNIIHCTLQAESEGVLSWRQRIVKSELIRYFTDPQFIIADRMENALNFMALILALLLTIPYGSLAALNSDYFVALHQQMESCPEVNFQYSYSQLHDLFLSNCCCTIYSSMAGLILIVSYYVLKPNSDYEMRRFSRIGGRILLFCVLTTCLTSIVGVMDLAALTYQFYSTPISTICTGQPWFGSMLWPGLIALIISLLVSIVLAF